MINHQVTIKDIGRILNISPSTVSRALKDHPDISVSTKKAVVELAAKLNYRPNAIALSLRNRKSKIIGVIVPEVVHYFFSTIISSIEEVAQKKGYSVMIFQTNEIYERELESVNTLLSSRIDGLLVSITKETPNADHFKELTKHGIPVVFFDRILQDIKADKVIVDDHDGAFKAVEYLIQSGCKRICHFGGAKNRLIGMNRFNGYKHALEKARIAFDENLVLDCDTYDLALEKTASLFNRKNFPDAIFAVNDLSAIGAIKALHKLGLRVPEDVSVIGFENSLYAKIIDPGLTSVMQPGSEMGKYSAELLFKRIESEKDYNPQLKVLRTSLVVRESTKNKF